MGGDFGLTRMTMALIRAHQRDVERNRKIEHKLESFRKAEREVEVQVAYIERITSFHKECGPTLDWQIILNYPRSEKPLPNHCQENLAILKRNKYIPNFWTKLFHIDSLIIKNLDAKIDKARRNDKRLYDEIMKKFNEEDTLWENTNRLARGILNNDPEAYKSLIKLWKDSLNLEEIGELLDIEINDKDRVTLTIKDKRDCIPQYKKRALKRGDVSLKKLPDSSFHEIYQHYICSSALRVIREIFAVLPLNSVQVNIVSDIGSTITGHTESHCILSVKLFKDHLQNIEWSKIDPVKFIEHFEHRMDFKKTKGFNPILKLTP